MLKVSPRQLVSLPWLWQGPTHERDAHGNEWWEIRIKELPDFFVAASTREGAIVEAAPALEAFLSSYVEQSAPPPWPEVLGSPTEPPAGYEVQLRDLEEQVA